MREMDVHSRYQRASGIWGQILMRSNGDHERYLTERLRIPIADVPAVMRFVSEMDRASRSAHELLLAGMKASPILRNARDETNRAIGEEMNRLERQRWALLAEPLHRLLGVLSDDGKERITRGHYSWYKPKPPMDNVECAEGDRESFIRGIEIQLEQLDNPPKPQDQVNQVGFGIMVSDGAGNEVSNVGQNITDFPMFNTPSAQWTMSVSNEFIDMMTHGECGDTFEEVFVEAIVLCKEKERAFTETASESTVEKATSTLRDSLERLWDKHIERTNLARNQAEQE